MAMMAPTITSDEASEAMLSGLTERIRDELRKRILASIEPDIEAAVTAAVASFEIAIKSYHEPMHMRDTIRVLIERR